jgi:hypothetical protein
MNVHIRTFNRAALGGPTVIWEAIADDGTRWTSRLVGYIQQDGAIRAAMERVGRGYTFTSEHKAGLSFPTEPTIQPKSWGRAMG